MAGERAIWRWAITAIVVLAATLFALFVWPTRFRFEQQKRGRGFVIVRINRISGEVVVAHPSGETSSDSIPKRPYSSELPAEKVSRISVTAGLGPVGASSIIYLTIYNGTDALLTDIGIEVTSTTGGTRAYAVSAWVEPLSGSSSSAILGYLLPPGEKWSFRVTGAKGHVATEAK
jgi:hypothetical protein